MNSDELREKFWKDDQENGGYIFQQYQDIKNVLSSSHPESEAFKRFLEIKEYAIHHTDYYKNFKVDDEFPVVDKIHLTKFQESHKSNGDFLTPTHISSTSGSTGTPFSVIQDFVKRKRNIADLKVFGELCNYPSHERMVFLRVLSAKLHRTKQQEESENIFYVDSSDLSPNRLNAIIEIILEKKPRILFSYSSTLVELAKHIKNTNQLFNFSMTSILTGGEGISEENRLLLQEVFKCTVYRRYSDMELGILAQDTGDGGCYYLNWGSYYFEVLKTDCDKKADIDEVGRIVITDLFNKAFPMIRYDTGDLGVLGKDRNGVTVLKEIYGRKRDCIYATDGRLISPAKIFVSMWGAKNINQWQFIQNAKTDYTLKINCIKKINENELIEKLKTVVGENAKINLEYVDEVPVTQSNKRRAVICNYEAAI